MLMQQGIDQHSEEGRLSASRDAVNHRISLGGYRQRQQTLSLVARIVVFADDRIQGASLRTRNAVFDKQLIEINSLGDGIQPELSDRDVLPVGNLPDMPGNGVKLLLGVAELLCAFVDLILDKRRTRAVDDGHAVVDFLFQTVGGIVGRA